MKRLVVSVFYSVVMMFGLIGAGFADGCVSLRAVGDGVMEGPAPLCVAKGALIAAEGDSLTYGMDTGGTRPAINGASFMRSASPYPEQLAKKLGGGVRVENLGYPGDVATQGITRWKDAKPAEIVFIMYGTNDAAKYVPLADFKATLNALVARRVAQGAKVVLLTPPPAEDRALETLIGPYRVAVKEVARARGVYSFDNVKALAGVKGMWTDGLHLSAQAYAMMGARLAGYVGIVSAKHAQK